jgi:hypothetical protein
MLRSPTAISRDPGFRKRSIRATGLRLGEPPAITIGTGERPARCPPNQNIENNPMQSSRRWQKRVKPAGISQAIDRAAGLAYRLMHQSINVIARSACDEAIHAADRRKAGLLRFARNDVDGVLIQFLKQFVGWVERSDTHHGIQQGDGHRKCSTHPARCALEVESCPTRNSAIPETSPIARC